MKSRSAVLISIVLAMLVASIDTTIMNTTMPIIAKELGRFDLYAWSFAAYMITTTILSPVAGRLSDIYGRKRIFGCGILLFFLGSLLCGISDSMVQLIIFRAIQGIGAGFMMPFPAIIAGDLFSVEKRGKIQALFTAMWGISAILAPLLGSLFVEFMTWRWIFFINLPVSIVAFLMLLPYKEQYQPKKTKVDYIGAILFAAGVTFLLLVTIIESNTVFYALIGVILLIIFYFYEKRHSSPIVPLTMFQNRTISWINVNSFIGTVALFGTSSFIPLFLQKVAGISLFMSGVALLGIAAGWMIVSVPAGKWIVNYGYRVLLIIGNTLLLCSGILLVLLNENHAFLYVFTAMFIQGLAYGLLSTVGLIGAQQLVGTHEKGVSASFFMFCRNMGTAIGVTIMGAILTSGGDYMEGVHHLFIFGFIGSILAFASAFFIKDHIHNEESTKATGSY